MVSSSGSNRQGHQTRTNPGLSPSRRRRATTDEAKAQRRRKLLDTARALFAETPYFDVTMAQIARSAGVAKGTTYLYFRTKEELFLELYRESLDNWLDELLATLDRERVQIAVSDRLLADRVAESLLARPTFLRLQALLHLVLEQNLEPDTAVEFKTWLRDRLAATGARLESALPRLGRGDGVQFLLRLNALVVGLHQMAHPTGAIAEALERDDLAPLRIDFAAELPASLACLLRGWQSGRRT